MISPRAALRLVLKNCRRGPVRRLSLKDGLGYVLAEDIVSPVDLPHWDNSAMDGFALRSADTAGASVSRPVLLKIMATIQAGEGRRLALKKGEAARIMTGAPVPANADTILIKEDAALSNGRLKVTAPLKPGRHIRRKGEEIRKGERLKLRGVPINAGLIGFLASLGRSEIRVYSKPAVAVISTGSELTAPGRRLSPGKIYDSNSAMIEASLKELGLKPAVIETVSDEPGRLKKAVALALKTCDVLVLTGGVSAGEYDQCRPIFRKLGVRTVFWKVSQKPGKPLFVGRLKRRLVFGLPGNPASVHLCFNAYAAPALLRWMGWDRLAARETAVSETAIRRDRSKTLFLKARLIRSNGKSIARVLPHQASHMISSLHETDGFVVIDPGTRDIQKGENVAFDRLASRVNAA